MARLLFDPGHELPHRVVGDGFDCRFADYHVAAAAVESIRDIARGIQRAQGQCAVPRPRNRGLRRQPPVDYVED